LSNSKPNKNAIIHGLYSDSVVLEGEKPEEFRDLLEAYRNEYSPEGVSEEEAVFDLASLCWKKRRLETGLQQALNKQRALSSTADASGDGWDSVADVTRAMAKSQIKAAEVACDLILKQLGERFVRPDEANDSGGIEFEKLTALAKEVNDFSKELIVPILHVVEKQKLDQIERAYNPDIMEQALKIHAEFDRRIEKALKRLVMIKDYKKFYVPKSVAAKPVQIEALPVKPIGEKIDTGSDAGPLVIT